MFQTKFNIILASNSPRRQQLLKEMRIDFRVIIKSVEEDFHPEMNPEEIALYLCEKKINAFDASEIGPDTLIITADTIVCLGDEILNKPVNREQAIEMIEKLSGRLHRVITGVALRSRDKMISFTETTEVVFKNLSRQEIEFYTDQFKPYDKAGAYGIQEWIGLTGIERINGSYYNVVGLPTARLWEELAGF